MDKDHSYNEGKPPGATFPFAARDLLYAPSDRTVHTMFYVTHIVEHTVGKRISSMMQ